MRPIRPVLAAALAIAAVATPAVQAQRAAPEPSCATLQRLVAAAPEGFRQYRTLPDGPRVDAGIRRVRNTYRDPTGRGTFSIELYREPHSQAAIAGSQRRFDAVRATIAQCFPDARVLRERRADDMPIPMLAVDMLVGGNVRLELSRDFGQRLDPTLAVFLAIRAQ